MALHKRHRRVAQPQNCRVRNYTSIYVGSWRRDGLEQVEPRELRRCSKVCIRDGYGWVNAVVDFWL